MRGSLRIRFSEERYGSKKAYIRQEKRVGCVARISVCPTNAIRMKVGRKSEVNTEKCIACGSYVNICRREASILTMFKKGCQ